MLVTFVVVRPIYDPPAHFRVSMVSLKQRPGRRRVLPKVHLLRKFQFIPTLVRSASCKVSTNNLVVIHIAGLLEHFEVSIATCR